MKKIKNIPGSLIGKVSNIFIFLFIKFFIYRQYKGFTSAVFDFDSVENSTPNFN